MPDPITACHLVIHIHLLDIWIPQWQEYSLCHTMTSAFCLLLAICTHMVDLAAESQPVQMEKHLEIASN